MVVRTREAQKKINKRTVLGVAKNKIALLVARFIPFNAARVFFYRLGGVRIKGTPFIGIDTLIDDQFPELIQIAPTAVISYRCALISHDDTKSTVGSVNILDRAFIGTGAIILPGVTVGENSVIGAGAVVTKDVPPGRLYLGVPAKDAGAAKKI